MSSPRKSIDSKGHGENKNMRKRFIDDILAGRIRTRRSPLHSEIRKTHRMCLGPTSFTFSPAPGVRIHARKKLPSSTQKAEGSNAQTEKPCIYLMCSRKVNTLDARRKLLEKLGFTPEQIYASCVTVKLPKPVNINQNQDQGALNKSSDENGVNRVHMDNEGQEHSMFSNDAAPVDVDLSIEGLKIDNEIN